MRESVRNFPERARKTPLILQIPVYQSRAGSFIPPAYRNFTRKVQATEKKINQERGPGGQDLINSSYVPFFCSMSTTKDHTFNRLVNFNT
jgi:hypothetical protein